METNKLLLFGAIGVGAYLLLKPSTVPGTTASTTLLDSILPTGTTSPGALVGINSGVKGGPGSFYTVANYAQLLASVPNLGNPNYLMTDAEAQQYLNNYTDLQQGLPGWIGKKGPDGYTPTNIIQAAKEHWKLDGCAEKRIYLPLQPPSTANFIPPPPNPKSSGGSSVVSDVVGVVGKALPILAMLLGPNESHPADQLNDKEIEMFTTGAAIVKKILPFYLEVAPNLVDSIEFKIDDLISKYAD